ncbi:MAG: hypothetical protein KI786_05275 [Mameliella sp.]|nr:hypothetical protein [Phaeodactylibacter sp.]
MKLYLHIGTEKTGSSHLQSVMALNRVFLQQNSIWFPSAGKRERQMLRGEISAGNAQPLADAVEAGKFHHITHILQKHLVEAQKKDCEIVLLSNEILVLALSGGQKIKAFQQAARAAGFSEFHYLLILRDPVDQALSLYKHRAKAGTAPEIEEWPATHYHYGNGLRSFLQQATDCHLQLRCRKYGRHLEQLLFEEWLGINPDQMRKPDKRVNPSLSISELLLIRQARQLDPVLPGLLYDALLNLPKDQKAIEPRIEQYYKAVLSNALSQYDDTWKACNQRLPADTPLALPERQAIAPDKVMTFSAQQGLAIGSLMQQLRSPGFLMQLTLHRYKRKLGKLRSYAKRQLS